MPRLSGLPPATVTCGGSPESILRFSASGPATRVLFRYDGATIVILRVLPARQGLSMIDAVNSISARPVLIPNDAITPTATLGTLLSQFSIAWEHSPDPRRLL